MHVTGRLGVRTFLKADQDKFAALSGDCNPMHVDAVAARRTQAGAPVVHGVHALLWSLDLLMRSRPDHVIADVSVRFERFLYVGEEVEAVLVETASDKVVVELRTGGTRATVITLGSAAGQAPQPLSATPPPHPVATPAVRDVEDLAGLAGAFLLVDDPGGMQAAFPDLIHVLGARTVRSLAGLSTLVGMECPGLRSIFSKLHVGFAPGEKEDRGDGNALRYSVRRLQALLRSAVIDVEAPGLTGSVEAFVRQPPVAQPQIDALRSKVPGDFTRGDRVLIVGGSRGLGELTAKLAALGGASVTITYTHGAEEARAVATEIEAAGGHCDAVRLDVRASIGPQLPPTRFTHCYYFATPPIFRKRGSTYDRAVLDTFLTFYVDAVFALVEVLVSANPSIRIFTPSTSAIDERPKGSLEYILAKLAGEHLVGEMARQFLQARIVTMRFPRILTDQTATVLPVTSEDPLGLLVPLMRDLHRQG